MIERIGFDLVDVSRIEQAMRNPRFLTRILTPNEIDSMGELTPERVAGRWAAKEAVAKAVGVHLLWREIEIATKADGQPIVRVLGGHIRPDQRVHLSISHERSMAGATAILERTLSMHDSL